MQLIPVYLYPNRITAYTSSSWTNERVRRVYNRNVKIYLGADNLLEFQIKNGDQKPVSIANSHVMFSMISNDAKKLLVQKDCVLVSTSQGKISVGLSEQELYDIDLGFYSYSRILTYAVQVLYALHYTKIIVTLHYYGCTIGIAFAVEIIFSWYDF